MNVVMTLAGLLACLLVNTFPSAWGEQWHEDQQWTVRPGRSDGSLQLRG